MHRELWIVPLLAAATVFSPAAIAQSDPHTIVERKSFVLAPGCPVGLAARQQPSPTVQALVSLEDASTSAHPHPNDAGVQVTLNSLQSKVLTEARVVVFYIAAGTRLLPVTGSTATQPAPTPHKKTFTLTAGSAPDSARRLSASLRVGPAASLLRVEVTGLTYADGSTWQPKENETCSIRISHVLLVDGSSYKDAPNREAPKSNLPVWSEHVPVNPPVPWQGGSAEKPQ